MKRIGGMLLGVTAVFLLAVAPAQAAMRVIVARMLGGQVEVVGFRAAKKAPISWQGTEVATSTLGGTFFFHNGAVPASCVGKLSDGVETAYIAVQGCVPTGVNLAATGQTDCWDGSPSPETCTNTGQDGEYQAGVPFPSPRFTVNGNGTVTDHLTGLIWLQDADCSTLNVTVGGSDWYTALTNVATLLKNGTCSLTDGSKAGDWRLPNRKELESLVDAEFFGPALSNAAGTAKWTANDDAFDNVLSGSYWSSTSYALNSALAWYVYFSDGGVYANDKTDIGFVLPVRGGL